MLPLIGRGQATGVGLSALCSAAVSYVVLLIAAHTLPPTDNALFLTYWALLFGTFGLITGLNAEAARATWAGDNDGTVAGPRIWWVAVGLAAATSLVIGLSGLLWAPRVLDADHAWLVGILPVAGLGFSGYLAVAGVLAGRQLWHSVILATLVDAAVRMGAVLLALVAFDSLDGLAVASSTSAFAWLLLLSRRDVRVALTARSDVRLSEQVGNFLNACAASASSAALVVGFPVLIRVTSDSQEYLGAAGLLLAIALTRAPLLMPLQAYQGVALMHFVRQQEQGLRALYPIAAAVVAVTGFAAAAAALVGPALFHLLLGRHYSASAGLLAGLTVGAGMLVLLTLTGACCLAVGGHRAYAVGWLIATSAAVALLLVPLELERRTVFSLVVAPVFGVVVHGWGVRDETLRRSGRLNAPTRPHGAT